jgi:hypothetical protein
MIVELKDGDVGKLIDEREKDTERPLYGIRMALIRDIMQD